MRRFWMALLALLVTGCSSTLVDYAPQSISEQDAYAVIKQVVMAQPQTLRPDSVYIDQYYMGFDAPGAAGKPVTSDASERIYFNSIDSLHMYKLFGRYTVQLFRADGQALQGFSMDSRTQAERFIDAVQFYRSQAPESSGFN
ncbi:hypothetical protein A9179_09490 [Pseudomonas alcaligenes]|uniref:Lipoprotein n=1 Tax=Aquipseudomonas alcaligenes TaxID=43263 RepID=A0ABR7S0F3_AQUAC|nr:hypothetical protein [Pseudomonas alcaligenes]MBC9250504.1 hypothetical protein [Pseudomonas alcaligenes]